MGILGLWKLSKGGDVEHAQTPPVSVQAAGCLDLVTIDRVAGWAIDPEVFPEAATLELVADGTIIQTFKPDLRRSDVLALGMPDVTCGFDVSLPPGVADTQATISVRFDRKCKGLTNSPTLLPRQAPPLPLGHFERIEGDRVIGWAIDPQIRPAPTPLLVFINGLKVAEIESNVERPDVLKLGVPPGTYGFDAHIPALSKLTHTASVAVHLADTLAPLPNSPQTVIPRRGGLVSVEGAELIGWVKAASSDPVTPAVDIFVDEEVVGWTRADAVLDSWVYGDLPPGSLGFRFTLPDRFRTRRYRTVSMRFTGSGHILEGCPREVRWAAAPAGQQLALLTPRTDERGRLPTRIIVRSGSLPRDRARGTGVVIQAVFSETGAASPSVRAITSEFRALGFAVAIINNSLPAGSTEDCELASCCDLLLHKVPGGRDFGAWYSVVDEIAREAPDAACFVFINDSIIGPVRSLDSALKNFRASLGDLWALSESFQTAYHLQTSMFCMSRGFFLCDVFRNIVHKYPFPEDKDSVILCGEIDLSQTALRHGARLRCLAPYGPLASAWLESSAVRLSELLSLQRDEDGFFSDVRYEIEWIKRTRASVIAGKLMNPQHDFWNTLIDRFDYPFLKRELLAHNPAQIPVNEQIWSTLSASDQADLHEKILHELIFHGSTRFVLPPDHYRRLNQADYV